MFKCLPFLKACGRHIDYIDKRHCSLLSVPDDVLRSSRTLEECHLDANQIKELPRNFFRLARIRQLTLSDNELTRIPPAIGNFTLLVELDLSRNEISELPTNFKFLEHLSILDISNNPLHRLPDGFSQLGNLRNLNVNDISIAELPTDFGNLKNLQKLELRDNCLKTLPNSFAQLQKMEFLDLGGNEFHALPPFIGQLISLTDLFIDGNELKELPPEIGNLARLQQLDASENFLESLPEQIRGLTSLTDFTLSQNSLDTLPNGIGHLKRLTVFKCDQNQLITLTVYIGSCVALEELSLTENFLSSIPQSIGGLQKLIHLNVDRNRLSDIPLEIGRCSCLNILSLRNNRIHRLPREIGMLSQLHVLDVAGNRLSRLPNTLSKCQLKALWLSENQAQPMVKLQKDTDEATGEEFLTCYLLPQEAFETESMENFLDPNAGFDNGGVVDDLSPDHDFNRVRFSGDEDSVRNADSKLFSKEAKLRHPKFDKKAVDGHVILKDSTHTKDTVFAPGRGTPPPTMDMMDEDEAADIEAIRTRKISAPPQSNPRTAVLPTSASITLIGQDGRGRSKSDTAMPPSSLVYPISHPPANGTSVIAVAVPAKSHTESTTEASTTESESSGSESSTGSSRIKGVTHGSAHTGPNNNKKHAIPTGKQAYPDKKVRVGVTISEVPVSEMVGTPTNQTPNRHQSGEMEEYTYSSGGEEIDTIARHVGFSEDVEDNEDKESESAENLKLIRRDTPHYTKRARIQQKMADGADSEEVVLSILDKYRNPGSSPLPPTSQTNWLIQPTLSGAINAAAVSSIAGPGLETTLGGAIEEERKDIYISRQPGVGLGISIAGGIGSVAYRGQDQGIFISKINETGPAAQAGLKLGDKLIRVNDAELIDVEHQVGVNALRSAGNEIHITVMRQVLSSAPLHLAAELDDCMEVQHKRIKCTLVRDTPNLGFSIVGGSGSLPREVQDESIYISKINENGAAQKCGQLEVGDRIVKINGIDVSEARHDQAVALLMGSEGNLDLEVIREHVVAKENNGPLSPPPQYAPAAMVNGKQIIDGTTELIVIQKNGPLGLAICGGSDHNSHPFGINNPGIFISRIVANGAASQTNLRVGDRILKVNGRDVTKATHEEAVLALVESKEIALDVRHDPQPPGMRELYLEKQPDEKVGISIVGGLQSARANPDDEHDEGIFISRVSRDGAVGRDGRVKVGDRLLEVNGHSLLGASHQEALKTLREVNCDLSILVCDGIPPHKTAEVFSSGNRARLSSSTSVDLEDEAAMIAAQASLDLENAFNEENVPYSNSGPWPKSPPRYPPHSDPSLDPLKAARIPNAGLPLKDNSQGHKPDNPVGGEEESVNLSFRSKRRYFEKEIERTVPTPSVSISNNNKPPRIISKGVAAARANNQPYHHT